MGMAAMVYVTMKCSTLEFEFRIIELSEVYTDDQPQSLQHLTKNSPDWLRLIDGELEIFADGEMFYSEEVFPLGEFVRDLISWVRAPLEQRCNYSFDNSMNFEDQEGVFTFCRDRGGWRMNSLWEEIPGGIWVPEEEFEYKLNAFIAQVRARVLELWGVDLAEIEQEAVFA